MRKMLVPLLASGLALASLAAVPRVSLGQASGNVGYSQSGAKARAEQSERNKRALTPPDLPPTNTSMFVEAQVLMNVLADEFVAVFGISQDGVTVAEANAKMDAAVKGFTDALKTVDIGEKDIFVDFVLQPKIYEFELTGDLAREKLAGFEVKKNVSVRYTDRTMLDRLVVVAAGVKVFDLVKVDYVVKDIGAVEEKLMAEAAAIVKQKVERYDKLLGIKVQPSAQIYAERSAIHYPSTLYDSYTAAESEAIGVRPNTQRYTVQQARKGRTFVFNGLDGDGFDKVINPVIVEPVVQFTLYLKVKYEVALQ